MKKRIIESLKGFDFSIEVKEFYLNLEDKYKQDNDIAYQAIKNSSKQSDWFPVTSELMWELNSELKDNERIASEALDAELDYGIHGLYKMFSRRVRKNRAIYEKALKKADKEGREKIRDEYDKV